MHRPVSRHQRGGRDERGAVAIMTALAVTAILVVTAMVLDFGLVRIDRQIDRSAADAATLAGLHGLNTGDGIPHPYPGVCTAARYLKANSRRFSGIDENVGWSNGLGATTRRRLLGHPAAQHDLQDPPTGRSWAKWSWSGTSRGVTLDVTIESGYDLAANQWAEDVVAGHERGQRGTEYQGCDNLAVTISQSREPGLGSLATDSTCRPSIRIGGPGQDRPGDSAPAMLLLKRTGCPVLVTGASGGSSSVQVLGAVATDGSGKTQPGTIHSDSDGTGCTGGNNSGSTSAASPPTAWSPTPRRWSRTRRSPDPEQARLHHLRRRGERSQPTIIRDSLDNVYGSSALTGTLGTKSEVTGRTLVTRGLVDERYFPGSSPPSAAPATRVRSGTGCARRLDHR